ncbi:hypothetical protein, partial [Novosphingobium cyanobacteriorum]
NIPALAVRMHKRTASNMPKGGVNFRRRLPLKRGQFCTPVYTPLRFVDANDETLVYSADFTPLGRLAEPLNPDRLGLALASVGWLGDTVDVRYLGPGDLLRK